MCECWNKSSRVLKFEAEMMAGPVTGPITEPMMGPIILAPGSSSGSFMCIETSRTDNGNDHVILELIRFFVSTNA